MADEKDERKAPQRVQTRQLSAVIDRIEDGDIAVVIVNDEQRTQIDLDVSRLPEGARDGDHLLLTFAFDERGRRTLKSIKSDPKSRAEAEDRVKKLQEQLQQSSGTQGRKDFKL